MYSISLHFISCIEIHERQARIGFPGIDCFFAPGKTHGKSWNEIRWAATERYGTRRWSVTNHTQTILLSSERSSLWLHSSRLSVSHSSTVRRPTYCCRSDRRDGGLRDWGGRRVAVADRSCSFNTSDGLATISSRSADSPLTPPVGSCVTFGGWQRLTDSDDTVPARCQLDL